MLLHHIFTNYVCVYMNSEMFTARSYYKLRLTYSAILWLQRFFRVLVLAFLPYFTRESQLKTLKINTQLYYNI